MPIFGTVKTTLSLVVAQASDLVVAAAGLFPLYYALALASAGSRNALIDALALSAGLMVMAVMSVAWYRTFLLGARAALLPRLSRRHLRMSLMALLLSLLIYGPAWVAEAFVRPTPVEDLFREVIAVAILVTVLLVSSYLFLRLFLVLAAIALDETFGLRDALRASAGNGWRLLLVSILLTLPWGLLLIGADIAFAASLDEPNWVSLAFGLEGPGIGGLREAVYVALQSLVHVVFGVLSATLGSVAFTKLTAWAPPSSGAGT
ncbi:hypothetical protein [Algihabitans albus]|uniref:hypothetical protein n=1 Tax=Algihabitans albus TaxID=2164067 RepID=UPI000E5D86D2|nr:hypothetical protein [Algihabitans albus]